MVETSGPGAHARWLAERTAAVTGRHGDLALVRRQPVNWLDAVQAVDELRVSVFRVPGETGVRVRPCDRSDVAIDGVPVEREAFLGRATCSGGPLLTQAKRSAEVWLVDGEDYELRIYDEAAPRRAGFERMDSFDYDEDWVLPATFVNETAPRVRGRLFPEVAEFVLAAGPPTGSRELGGTVTVTICEATYTLLGRRCGEFVVVAFSDPMGPDCGRLLFLDQPADGPIVVDFNRALLPGCCFSPISPEPPIPPQNRIAVPVPAGERGVRWTERTECRAGGR